MRCREGTTGDDVEDWLAGLEGARQVIAVRVAGEDRWAAIDDASRLRDALGVSLPPGVPQTFLEPVADPLGDLVARYARTHVPFHAAEVARAYGLGTAVATTALARLVASGRVVEGELLPTGGGGTEFCDAEVLRLLRRRSLAALRAEVEPVTPVELSRFLQGWQGVGGRLRGPRRAAPGGGAAERGRAARERGRVPRAAHPRRRLLPRPARRAHVHR